MPKKIEVRDDGTPDIVEYEYKVEYFRQCLDCDSIYSYTEIKSEKQAQRNRKKFKL